MKTKLCECGCGMPAPIAPHTDRKRGWVKGQPLRFVHNHHRRKTHPVKDAKPQLCACGCGEYAGLMQATDRSQGRVKGMPNRYIRGHYPRGRKQSPEHIQKRMESFRRTMEGKKNGFRRTR